MKKQILEMCGAAVLGLSLFVNAGPARAQSAQTPDPKALALFNEAMALMEQGKYEPACVKLEESHQIQSGMGTLYQLSDCYQHTGRTASAWAGFERVAAMARAAGQVERAEVAEAEAAALQPNLSRLRVVVSPRAAVSGFTVRLDGVDVPRADLGKDVPVDPGNHRVSALAPGRAPWNSEIVAAQPGKVVTVEVPLLETAGVVAPSASGVGEGASVLGGRARGSYGSRDGTSARGQGASPDWDKSTAVIVAGAAASLVTVGLGVGFTVAASGKTDEAAAKREELRAMSRSNGGEICPTLSPEECDVLDGMLWRHDNYQNIALGAFVTAGVIGLATAGYVIWPASNAGEKHAVQVRPVIAASEGGIQIDGRF